jgi:hypothetical protein
MMGDELKISQGAATEGAETLSRTKWFAERTQALEERAQHIQNYREALMSEPGEPDPEALAKLTNYEKELSDDLAELAAERKAMEGGAAEAGASAEEQGAKKGKGKGSAKPYRHIANETTWYAVCTSPDLCKVGDSVIPFDSFAIINKRQKASPNVYAQDTPVYRVGDLHHGVLADAGSHVVAGTSMGGGYVKFLTGNDHILTNGLPTVRYGSECLVNCNSAGVGGAPGVVVTEVKSGESDSSDESATPEDETEDEAVPNEALQALLDAEQSTLGDFASNAWDSLKRMGSAMRENPGEALIGVGKGVLNLPTDLVNLLSMSGGGLPILMQARQMANQVAYNNNLAALEAYKAGDLAKANELAASAESIKNFGYVGDLFELENDAQKGGAIASIFVPLGGVVKAAGGAAKVGRGAKVVDAATDAVKGADAAGDATNAARGVEAADTAADAAKGADAGGDAAKTAEEGADAAKTREAEGMVVKPKSSPGFDTSNLESKLKGYLLNPGHPQNQQKAIWFRRALGFDQSNWERLALQLYFDPATALATKSNQYGQTFEQIISVVGANGNVIDTTFVFMKDKTGTVRLVTGIPARK